MSLKDLFHIFSKDDYEKDLKKKISTLEMNIADLKKTVSDIQKEDQNQAVPELKEPPIIIEKIHIEKIVLDKYELNNNFGQLGIKELKGKLNIGATYGSEFTTKPNEEESRKRSLKEKTEKVHSNQGPKVNLYPKRDD